MTRMTISADDTAMLVLPHLRVQNANAISSPLTHGFPGITAFMGMMWALQRKLAAAAIPLKLHKVGVICHHHEEQVTSGYVKTFNLTRNPVNSSGASASIVEEGRMHLDITLLFEVTQVAAQQTTLNEEAQFADWATQIGEIVSRMRIAGGTVLPTPSMPGRRTRPWMAVLPDTHEKLRQAFALWRRQWLPGYALVGRDDLLKDRHRALCEQHPDSTLLDAWLHAARFNYRPVHEKKESEGSNKKFHWADPNRPKGGGWTVPIPVGYAALSKPLPAGSVANARDTTTPFVFVESVYSFGQWISPHRLKHPYELWWRAESDLEAGLYRCRSGYEHGESVAESAEEDLPEFE
ncbi:type I-F CRISPR-associated protein Csy2 [Caballeronia sp. BR00000012568055]|uniref:type I-F CRISPR-associated protein Csy2 n=1 Tax=Caballeronia sp. BR00000012568055 TaxID=2918761 RepID=UPI0023F6EE4B|nr:type I-F CRISPR-associated protein Csy2 [Caballeronia sp. BR00000012568055]